MGDGKTVEWWDEWTARLKSEHGNGNGHGASLSIETLRLLPTPMTEPDTGNGHARNLGAEVKSLLPTPTVSDTNRAGEHGDGGLALRPAPRPPPPPPAPPGGAPPPTAQPFA